VEQKFRISLTLEKERLFIYLNSGLLGVDLAERVHLIYQNSNKNTKIRMLFSLESLVKVHTSVHNMFQAWDQRWIIMLHAIMLKVLILNI